MPLVGRCLGNGGVEVEEGGQWDRAIAGRDSVELPEFSFARALDGARNGSDQSHL